LYFLKLIVLDDKVAIVFDQFQIVVFNANIDILFSVDEDLLLALHILDTQFVESAAALGRVGLKGRFCLLVRQRVGRHRFRIVDTSRNDRLVGVALHKMDEDLHADSGDEHRTPFIAGPCLGYAHPARTAGIDLPVTVPGELYLYTAELVGEYLFSAGADDNRRLAAMNYRLRRVSERAEARLSRALDDTLKCVRIRFTNIL